MSLLKARDYFVLLLVIIISLVLTISAFQWSKTQAWKLMEQDFQQSANSYADFVTTTLNQRIEDLKSVERFYASSKHVSREEFSSFVADLVSTQDRFLAMMWVPRVPTEQRGEFEKKVSLELGLPYVVKRGAHHNQAGIKHKSNADHNVLTPVLYVEPLNRNLHALGYDLSSEALRRQTLHRAATTGQLVASERITLIHEGNDPTGFILILAVFGYSSSGIEAGKNKKTLIGYLVGRMSAYQVIQHALKGQAMQDINIVLRDLNASADNQVFVRLPDNSASKINSSVASDAGLVFSQPIDFAGHQWQVDVVARQSYITHRQSMVPQLLLLVGLVIVTILTLYLRNLMWQQKRMELLVQRRTHALDSSRARLNEAQRIAHIGSWEHVPATGVMEWSDEVYRILELNPSELEKSDYSTFLSLIHPNDRPLVERSYRDHLEKQIPYNITFRLQLHDGRIKYVHERCETQYDNSGVPIKSLGTMQDVSERKKAEEEILFLAHHDGLTGLPNRVLFRERFEQALFQAHRDKRCVALIFLDLDRFKLINDSLGHPVGDEMLREVAERLTHIVREVDILARHGGDEFLIALTNISSPEIAADITEKILKVLRQPFELEGHSLGASSSIGISVYPEDGDEFDILLRKADTAMYSAKGIGRDTYQFFNEQMNVDTLERLKMLSRINAAIEAEEFLLHYQPQVDMVSGKIIGVEALLRWQDSDGSFISPNKFIPIAEESGIILNIGDWVMKEACRQLAEWREAGHHNISMAVNLSALQIRQDDIVARLNKAVVDSAVPPQCIELELTESVLLEDMELTLKTMQQLKNIGFKLAIDDFGTGYSSLSYVRQLRADKLKIDRSFVQDISSDIDSTAIIRAVIHMANDLRIQIIAEGVETQEQAEILRRIGCGYVQGYYYGRPMPPEALLQRLNEA